MVRLPSLLRLAVVASAVVFVAWFLGLGWFLYQGLNAGGDPTAPTDAIVVLTGGRFRLESGIDLLEAHRARKLFISGVNQHVDRAALLRVLGPLPESATCCIVLGHDAADTYGNARETAEWMRREGYRSLRLVTSWYHIPRSRLEFERAMPDISVVLHPVFPLRSDGEDWRERAEIVPLVIREYGKYLAALARPALTPVRQAAPWLVPGGAVAEPPARLARVQS
jgi:uncharacterized SAM-binding protein YcdF (DUF218 family)